jgi:hypothetical protein
LERLKGRYHFGGSNYRWKFNIEMDVKDLRMWIRFIYFKIGSNAMPVMNNLLP